MTSRLTRLAQRALPVSLLSTGRKPRILPMTREDERIQAEIRLRIEARRREREGQP